MEKDRQFQLFRALVKEMIREKGIKLTGNFIEEATSEVKKLNERLKLDPPLTVTEFLETYVELADELADEYFRAIKRRVVSPGKEQ